MKSVHEAQKFPCPHCEYKANWNADLLRHIKSVHDSSLLAEIETAPISQDGESVEMKLKPEDMDSELEPKENKKLQGKYKATQKGDLRKHIKSIDENRKFPCPQCNSTFTEKGNLQKHIKAVHEGQKFQCPHCEYKTAWNKVL